MNRLYYRRFAAALLLTGLAACGGGGGDGNRATASVPPAAVNQAPSARISATTTDGFAPLSIDFSGAGSADGDGQITAYRWDFGDGSATVGSTEPSHTFTDPGSYNVQLTVTDDDGATGATLLNVRVRGARLTGTVQILTTSAVDADVNDRLTQPAPNNDFLTAQPLANPVRLGGFVNLPGTGEPTGNFFSSGDAADFFAITLSGNEVIVLNVADAAANLELRLWEADGDLVSATGGTRSTKSLDVPGAGDYFIEVFPATGPSNLAGGSNYVLSVGQDLSVSSRAPNRLSDAFVPGELLIAARSEAQAAALHRSYDLEPMGRAGRHFRARLRGRSDERIRQRLAVRHSELPQHGRMTPRQQQKYRTLLAIRDLQHDADVASVEPNLLLQPHLEPNDALYPLQWHLRDIKLPAAWDLSTGSPVGVSDVIVAVVDTGILLNHPDFAGQLVNGYDFISDAGRARDFNGIDDNPADEGDFAYGASSSFHGTHVAGTVAARTDNTEGVAGVAWGAKLMPMRALGLDGGTSYDVMQAVRYAAGLSNDSNRLPTQRADIINLSLGSPFFSASAQATIDEARSAGVILIASAGNESSANPSYPAAYNGVVSVSATTIDGGIAPYSNFGSSIDVAAPGGFNATDLNGDGFGDGVVSTQGDDSNPGSLILGYGTLNGTSMAAPHVAGVAALMKAVHPGLTPLQFDTALVAGDLTDEAGTAGFDQFYGHGLINAQKAVLAGLALVGGGGSDPGPVLGGSLSAVNLGVLAAVQTVTISNLGSGTIQIDQTIASEPWLSIVAVALDADGSGLGSYELRVDRSGLGEGSYNATARFVPLDPMTNAVTVAVTAQVAGANPEADAGLFYVIAVNEDGSSQGNAAVVAANDGEYNFTLNDIPAGSYRIFAGSDMDEDGFLCDAGEACGAYRTLDALEQVVVEPITTPALPGIDFVAEFRAVIAAQAATADGAEVGSGSAGIPIRKAQPAER